LKERNVYCGMTCSRIGRRKKPIPTKPRLFDEEALSELGKALKEALAEL